jgi:type II protein arginine methyltransferase
MIEKDSLSLQQDLLLRFAQMKHADFKIADSTEPAFEPNGPQRTRDLIELLVAQGDAYMTMMQFADAARCFDLALSLDPEQEQAERGRRRVYCKIVPRWHFAMLNDEERNTAYERAINNMVTDKSIVLDIGSGSGLLAMMAARANAKSVISCEMNPTIAELARETVQLNGYADRIKIINKKSTDLRVGADMPERANLLVTEIVDCGFVGEEIIPCIMYAKEHLLTEDARIIPRAAAIHAIVVEGKRLHRLNHVNTSCGFDTSPFNKYSTPEYFPVRLGAFEFSELTEPFEVFRFDFEGPPITAIERKIEVPCKRDGLCHAIIFWFTLHLDDENTTSNRIGSTTHWTQAMESFVDEVPVRAGESIKIIARCEGSRLKFKLDKE